MARNVVDLFNSQTGQIQTYTIASESALNSNKITNDSPPTQQSVPSLFIEFIGLGAAFDITCQFAIGVDDDGNTIWGMEHDVLNDSDSNSIDLSIVLYFEANLYAQSWWKENDGFRIIVTKTGGTATGVQIRGSAIVR